MTNKIIQNSDQLLKKIKKIRSQRKKIVLCHGVFDLIHIGHIKHFEEAKKYGDILIVSLTSDKYVNKGDGRPVFNQNLRSEFLNSITCIDFIFINNHASSTNVIKIIKPNFYIKGPDYKNHQRDLTKKIFLETNAVKINGGKTIYTKSVTFSSSNLINKYSDLLTNDQKNYIKQIKKKYNFEKIKSYIDNFKKIKVLIIGETIIDQYNFCEALGKAGKESHIVIRDLNSSNLLGGAAAIANNISSYCKKISILSMIGDKNDHLKFIKKNLDKNISFNYIRKKNSPTIIKKRYIDHVNKNKLFGVYSINDDLINFNQNQELIRKFNQLIKNHDLIIVSDYGHGFIDNEFAKQIVNSKKYVSLNAQVNAANVGYHSLSKYSKANILVINEKELRHELRSKDQDLEILLKQIVKRTDYKTIVVTMGIKGSISINKKDNKIIKTPSFSKNVVDKVGAGDSMLAIMSLAFKNKIPEDISMLFGALAGSFNVKSLANSNSLSKNELLRTLEYSLK